MCKSSQWEEIWSIRWSEQQEKRSQWDERSGRTDRESYWNTKRTLEEPLIFFRTYVYCAYFFAMSNNILLCWITGKMK